MRSLRSIVDVIKPKGFGISRIGRFHSVPVQGSKKNSGQASTTAIAASTHKSNSSRMHTLETVNEDPLPATSVTDFDIQTAQITS